MGPLPGSTFSYPFTIALAFATMCLDCRNGNGSGQLARRLLIILLIAQALTQLFWLSSSAHSGQVAIPWLMNRGLRLFDDILEQHAPGSSVLAALAQRLLGLDPALTVKLLNTVLALAFTLLIYHLARRLAGSDIAGILAALVWAWWLPVYGNVLLYFDSLLAFCVLAALCVTFANADRPPARNLVLMGLLLGAATLFKQQAWLSLALVCLWLAYSHDRRSGLIFLVAAFVLPLAQWALLLAQGSLDSYVYWNWTFNLRGLMDGAPLDGDLFRKLLISNALVLPFALLALRGDRRQTLLLWLWLAGLSVLYPRFGEIHAMGHLALAAVMSGIVLARVGQALGSWREWDATRLALIGLIMSIGLGWLWTGAASYLQLPLGAGATLGYDEFAELAAELNMRKQPGDTLFVLPQTDSAPQLHPLTDMLPPGTWVKGWHWYFKADGVTQRLLDEWADKPPSWIVVFPELIIHPELGMDELLQIVARRYRQAAAISDVYGHGAAEIYHLRAGSDPAEP